MEQNLKGDFYFSYAMRRLNVVTRKLASAKTIGCYGLVMRIRCAAEVLRGVSCFVVLCLICV